MVTPILITTAILAGLGWLFRSTRKLSAGVKVGAPATGRAAAINRHPAGANSARASKSLTDPEVFIEAHRNLLVNRFEDPESLDKVIHMEASPNNPIIAMPLQQAIEVTLRTIDDAERRAHRILDDIDLRVGDPRILLEPARFNARRLQRHRMGDIAEIIADCVGNIATMRNHVASVAHSADVDEDRRVPHGGAVPAARRRLLHGILFSGCLHNLAMTGEAIRDMDDTNHPDVADAPRPTEDGARRDLDRLAGLIDRFHDPRLGYDERIDAVDEARYLAHQIHGRDDADKTEEIDTLCDRATKLILDDARREFTV